MMSTTTVSMSTKKINLKEALELAENLSIAAAKLLLKKQKTLKSLKITNKEAQGVASNADFESEKLIIKGIKKKYPDHYILAEESAYAEFKGEMSRYEFLKTKEWVWIIDPLDGTNNYLNGLDYYGVCIALAHYGKPVMGLVLRPKTKECFFALKNKGARVRYFSEDFTKSLKVTKLQNKKATKKLKDSLLVTGFVTEKGQVFEAEFAMFKDLMSKSRGIRRMGSAALDLCYVAQGQFDCFWEKGLSSWDVAASGLICMEAGLKVSDYKDRPFHPFQESIIAATPTIHKEMLSLFRNRL